MSRIRVFACEPHPIVSEGLTRVLENAGDMDFIGASGNTVEALEEVRKQHPDLLLVDQSGGLKLVFQFISDVKSIWPQCQVILWVNELAEVDCFRALQLGARGVLKKSMPIESVLECLRSVHGGNVWIEHSPSDAAVTAERRLRLTKRERDIVHQVCAGLKNREIAEALAITAGTVKVHLMHIFEKTGVKDRFELAVHGRKLLGIEHSSEMEKARETAVGAIDAPTVE
jgi:two-component system, NarL family, nitrate/nitrite response regulator NarL